MICNGVSAQSVKYSGQAATQLHRPTCRILEATTIVTMTQHRAESGTAIRTAQSKDGVSGCRQRG